MAKSIPHSKINSAKSIIYCWYTNICSSLSILNRVTWNTTVRLTNVWTRILHHLSRFGYRSLTSQTRVKSFYFWTPSSLWAPSKQTVAFHFTRPIKEPIKTNLHFGVSDPSSCLRVLVRGFLLPQEFCRFTRKLGWITQYSHKKKTSFLRYALHNDDFHYRVCSHRLPQQISKTKELGTCSANGLLQLSRWLPVDWKPGRRVRLPKLGTGWARGGRTGLTADWRCRDHCTGYVSWSSRLVTVT